MADKIGRRGLFAAVAAFCAWLTGATAARGRGEIRIFADGAPVPATLVERVTNPRGDTTLTFAIPTPTVDSWHLRCARCEPVDLQVFQGETCAAGRFRVMSVVSGYKSKSTTVSAVSDSFRVL
jgi:hypothetical protein